MSIKGRKPHSNRSLHYCLMFKKRISGSIQPLKNIFFSVSSPNSNITSYQIKSHLDSGRRCGTPHGPQSSPEPLGLLQQAGVSNSPGRFGVPTLGASHRPLSGYGSRPPSRRHSPSRPAPPQPHSTLHHGCASRRQPLADSGRRRKGQKGWPLASTPLGQGPELGPPRWSLDGER